jgi:hypothetical protein
MDMVYEVLWCDVESDIKALQNLVVDIFNNVFDKQKIYITALFLKDRMQKIGMQKTLTVEQGILLNYFKISGFKS